MIAGIVCIVVGVALRGMAMIQLGENWSLQLKRPERIVTTGIYRLMRHPSYLGSLLIILGLSLIKPVVAIMAISFFFFLERIVDEEQILDCPDYREYKKKAGVFWPKRR